MPVLNFRLLFISILFNESEIEIFIVELKATLKIFKNEIHSNETQACGYIILDKCDLLCTKMLPK
jgi:hypothetical protein